MLNCRHFSTAAATVTAAIPLPSACVHIGHYDYYCQYYSHRRQIITVKAVPMPLLAFAVTTVIAAAGAVLAHQSCSASSDSGSVADYRFQAGLIVGRQTTIPDQKTIVTAAEVAIEFGQLVGYIHHIIINFDVNGEGANCFHSHCCTTNDGIIMAGAKAMVTRVQQIRQFSSSQASSCWRGSFSGNPAY